MNTYQQPNVWDDAVSDPQQLTGCEALSFLPGSDYEPTSRRADNPTGLDVEITVPQTWNELGRGGGSGQPLVPPPPATPALRRAEVTLPKGMSISPGQADGLDACTDEQANVGTEEPIDCPPASRIGNVEVETPLLTETLTGGIYVGSQESNDPESGEMYRMFIEVQNHKRGISLRLPGQIVVDPDTGQVKTIVDDAPQLPFESMKLHFKGGARGVLANPPSCGTYQVQSELTSWATGMPPVELTNEFVVDRGPDGGACTAGDPNEPGDPADLADRPFEPTMNAGVKDPVAGSFTPFVFQLKREDGDQEILSTEVMPPEGVTAKLAGLPRCGPIAAANGNCPEQSLIGTTIVGAGAGSNPFYIQAPNEGKVYLTHAYDPDGLGPRPEAPLGMLIQVPAIAGPFDLGIVNVQAAVYVDPETAQLNVVSDEIPQILKGVPLRLRDIRVRVDRDSFTLAPTDCDEQQVEALVTGSHGAEVELAQRFQVGECGSLGFEPEIGFEANNKDATDRSDHPALDTTLEMNQPDGAYASALGVRPQANIAKAVVTLPPSMILDQDSLGTICTRQQYADGECPENTQFGAAVAHSPLLDEPLQGPVYLRASDNPLPDLVADLDGIIDIDLAGRIDQTGGQNSRLRTTFDLVPDVGVSSFNLKLEGGNSGLLVNTKKICERKKDRRVDVELYAQNNDTAHQSPTISVRRCLKAAERKASRYERKASKLERKAKKAKRKGNRKRARKLERKAKKLERKARRVVRRAK